MEPPYRVLLLDTKSRNPNHYLCLAIGDALRQAGVETFYARYDNAIRTARAKECNVFLAFDGEEMHYDVCRQLSAMCEVSILWITDDPYEAPANLAASGMFDLVYTNDKNSVERYGGKAGHLPFAGSTRFHHLPVRTKSSGMLRYDVLFIGAAWPNRVRLLRSLLRDLPDVQFKIGLVPIGDAPLDLPLPEAAYLWRTSAAEWARLANRSRITLALHRDFTANPNGGSLASTPPPRLFEAALAGTLQLHDAVLTEIDEYFDRDREVVSYSSYRDCLGKIEYYLAHPDERDAIAQAAQLHALRAHTYEARIERLLQDLRRYSVRKTPPARNASTGKRSRLLFVTHNIISVAPFGGVEIYQDGIARKLGATHDVLFYYRDSRKGPNCYVLADADYNTVEEFQFDGEYVVPALSVPVKESTFASILTKYAIDLVHFHHLINHPASLVLIAKLLGIPTVVTLQDFWVMCDSHNLIDYRQRYCDIVSQPDMACEVCVMARNNKPARTQAVRRAFFARVLESADAVIGNTAGFHQILARFYPETATSKRAHVLPLPLPDMPVRRREQSTVWASEEPRERPGRIVRAAVLGNFSVGKGAQTLLYAMNRLRDAPIEFTILGRVDRPYDEILKGMNFPNVKVHGVYQSSELAALLEKMDITLHTSIWPETYCIAVSEAWHNGIAPIVTDIGALGERITHGENGWKVAADNPAQLLDLLLRLLRDPDLIARCRTNIKTLPRPYDTESEHIEKLEAIYQPLLRMRPRNPWHSELPAMSRLTLFETGLAWERSTWEQIFEIGREATQITQRTIAPGQKYVSGGGGRKLVPVNIDSFLPVITEELRTLLATVPRGLTFVDRINEEAPDQERCVTAGFNSAFDIKGWAFDDRKNLIGQDLRLVFSSESDAFYVPLNRMRREDLPASFGSPDLINAGFQVHLEQLRIPPDRYSLKLTETGLAGPLLYDLGITLVVKSPLAEAPTLRNSSEPFSVGHIDSLGGREVRDGRVLKLPPDLKFIAITGWCLPPELRYMRSEVYVTLEDCKDGTVRWVQTQRSNRPEAGKNKWLPEPLRPRFRAVVSAADLPGSTFLVRLAVAADDKLCYLVPTVRVELERALAVSNGTA